MKKIIEFKAYNSEGKDIMHMLPLDELVYLDDNDKLYLSSYNGGIVEYDYKLEQYVHNYRFTSRPVDIARLEIIKLKEEN